MCLTLIVGVLQAGSLNRVLGNLHCKFGPWSLCHVIFSSAPRSVWSDSLPASWTGNKNKKKGYRSLARKYFYKHFFSPWTWKREKIFAHTSSISMWSFAQETEHAADLKSKWGEAKVAASEHEVMSANQESESEHKRYISAERLKVSGSLITEPHPAWSRTHTGQHTSNLTELTNFLSCIHGLGTPVLALN